MEKAPLDTSKTIGTASEVVLIDRVALNTQRKAYILTNTSVGGQIIYLSFGQEAVVGNGIPLYVGGSTDRTPDQQPTQLDIRAISNLAGATISIHEEVY